MQIRVDCQPRLLNGNWGALDAIRDSLQGGWNTAFGEDAVSLKTHVSNIRRCYSVKILTDYHKQQKYNFFTDFAGSWYRRYQILGGTRLAFGIFVRIGKQDAKRKALDAKPVQGTPRAASGLAPTALILIFQLCAFATAHG